LPGESLHLKGVLCFWCRGVVIFRHLWMFKNWLATSKIYAHNSHFFHIVQGFLPNCFHFTFYLSTHIPAILSKLKIN
jgi:hypothetical protein